MDKIERAMQFAFDAHLTQKRKGSGIPYFTHVVEVMKRVSDYGDRQEDLLVAALLHDVHEDSPEYSPRIAEEFGPFIYKHVIECSRPEGDFATKEQKFDFLMSFYHKSTGALVIKIADRFCNVRDYLGDPNKEKYASTYALQAYPLYSAFIERVKKGTTGLPEEVQKRILFDIMTLKGTAKKEYPLSDELTEEEVRMQVL